MYVILLMRIAGHICMVVVHIGIQLSCLCDNHCAKRPKAHAVEVLSSTRRSDLCRGLNHVSVVASE